jgi:hypothetical protein
MAVDLGKMQKDAPHLVDLFKKVTDLMKDEGLDPARYKSAVVGTFDLSGSTEMGRNQLYTGDDQLMQGVADIALAAGFAFDDDGKVPLSFFHNNVISLGEITPKTSKNCLDSYRKHRFGGTNYVAALKWIVQEAGFGRVNLGDHKAWTRAIRTGDFSRVSPLEIKGRAKYPTYAIFATDGEPQDNLDELIAYLYLMSQLPIFVSCIGVGANRPFTTLEMFDNLPSQPNNKDGRLVDNVGSFDSADAKGRQDKMLELLLGEYPSFYAKARGLGMVTG